MPPTLNIGSIAIAITIIPTPPNHCNNARQSRIPGGALFKPIITVDPVVVMPDIDSKKASAMLRLSPEKTKGKAPTAATATQLIVVSKNACLKLRLERELALVASISDTPTNNATAAEPAKTCQSEFPVARSAIAGRPIAMAKRHISNPIIKRTGPMVTNLVPIVSVKHKNSEVIKPRTR
jgi:hypothetical protein